jgi:hypothetical protein
MLPTEFQIGFSIKFRGLLGFRSTYAPEAQRMEESIQEPLAAIADHKRRISDAGLRDAGL